MKPCPAARPLPASRAVSRGRLLFSINQLRQKIGVGIEQAAFLAAPA
jgi:hypothetical protein